MDRRRACIAAIGLVLCLAGCRQPPESGEGPAAAPSAPTKVVVYSPHGREMLEPFEQRFEQAHPELDLEWLDMGSQEVLDRLRAERANPLCDVWWGAPHTMFKEAARDGLLAPYTPTWSQAIDPARRDPEHRWYGQYLTPSVIVFNAEALTPQTAPQDWDELLDPRWKGKILIRDPLASGTMRTFLCAMILRQPTVEAGYQWLARLDANTKSYPANPALLHLGLTKQEGLVSVWALRDVVIQKRENGYPLGYVIPKSGCPTVTDGIAIVQGAPHLEAAKVFYEYVTAVEQCLWAAERFECLPARTDIDPAKLPATMPRKVPEMALDWDRIETEGKTWLTHWDQSIKGRGASGR